MSRIGKKPILIPQGVLVNLQDNLLNVKGPKGELSLKIPFHVTLKLVENQITVSVKDEEDAKQKAVWGTTARLVQNAITGVTSGYTKRLILSGIGFRASMKGKLLTLEVGFSHPVEFIGDDTVTIQVEGNNIIIISGIDKEKVGQVAANIRANKKPEPYKGKGIIYEGEIIRRKQGKQATGSGTK